MLPFQVTEQLMDEKLGRMVTRVVLPRVVMHSRHHYGVSAVQLTSFPRKCLHRQNTLLSDYHNPKANKGLISFPSSRHSLKILQV